LGFGSLLTAFLKPIFPNNAGMMVVDGVPRGFGVFSDIPPGAEMAGGYWIIPILIGVGLAILIITQRSATRFLVWWRARRGKSDDLPGWPI
jgi:hypothetical protein